MWWLFHVSLSPSPTVSQCLLIGGFLWGRPVGCSCLHGIAHGAAERPPAWLCSLLLGVCEHGAPHTWGHAASGCGGMLALRCSRLAMPGASSPGCLPFPPFWGCQGLAWMALLAQGALPWPSPSVGLALASLVGCDAMRLLFLISPTGFNRF